MKITVYNEEYEFSQVFNQEYIDEYQVDKVEPFDCLIHEIKTNHPFAYGWLESITQSKISNLFYWTDFTHIRFSK